MHTCKASSSARQAPHAQADLAAATMLEQLTAASTPLQLASPPAVLARARSTPHARHAGPATGPCAAPGITPCRPPPSPHLAAAFSPAKPSSTRALQRRHRLSYKVAAVHVDAELSQPTPVVLAARPCGTPPLSAAPIKGRGRAEFRHQQARQSSPLRSACCSSPQSSLSPPLTKPSPSHRPSP